MFFDSPRTRIRKQTEARLDQYSQPSTSFFLLIALSAAIAALGLIMNNASIVIGAMVVAPLITPLFGFSLSVLVLKGKRMLRALGMLISGTLLALLVAMLVSLLALWVEGSITLTPEIIGRTKPDLFFFLVAFFSGIAGAYAYAKPDISASLAGIAISVAVIPPLAVSGIGIVLQQWSLAQASFLLYGFNMVGICLGALFLFLCLGFAHDV